MNLKSKIRRREHLGYLFILPFFAVFFIFQLFPMVYGFVLSFTKYDGYGEPSFVGLANYIGLVKDLAFWEAFVNTWKIWLPNIVMQITIAMAIAFFLGGISIRIKGVGLFRAIFYFPNLVTSASIALLFSVLLDWQSGMLNQLLFGANRDRYIDWMGSPASAQFIISIIQTWIWFGYTAILLMAGLTGISRSYYESARVEGASDFQVFIKIALPLLKPVLIYIAITSFIGGMQIFDIPFVITQNRGVGQPQGSLITSTIYLYQAAFSYQRMGYSAAVSYMLFFIIALVSMVYIRTTRER